MNLWQEIQFFGTLTDHDRELFINYYVFRMPHAKYVMRRDVDYVVENGKIVVSQCILLWQKAKSSEYSRGIQQALEAKEGLQIHTERV